MFLFIPSYYSRIIVSKTNTMIEKEWKEKRVVKIKGPFPNNATRSFVFVLNHRFCLNSASDWSVIFNLSRLKIPSAFPPKNLKSLSKEFCLKQFYTF